MPESLIKMLGEMTFSFEFDLSKKKSLMRADPKEVRRLLKETGYFLQMPPSKSETTGLKNDGYS